MASATCGWCGKTTHMTISAGSTLGPDAHSSEISTQATYRCDNCHRFSIAWAEGKAPHSTDAPTIDKFIIASLDGVHWVPRIGDAVAFEDVPKHIASAASEAHETSSIGAKRASILMARSVIEACAKAHNITEGTLYAKIEKLAKKGIVRPLIAEAAHGIRDFGNDMAHGDFKTDVTQQDVDETLDLMAVVLSEVFQVDAKTKALRERYAARKRAENLENGEP